MFGTGVQIQGAAQHKRSGRSVSWLVVYCIDFRENSNMQDNVTLPVADSTGTDVHTDDDIAL